MILPIVGEFDVGLMARLSFVVPPRARICDVHVNRKVNATIYSIV